MTLLLVEKSRLHAVVQRIDDVGLRSGVRFAVMALVVLPLLPEGPYGPFGGVRPRELWALALFFSGLSFAGYVTRRLVGSDHGYLATGLLGGLVSSTNVTFSFARLSRSHAATDSALAYGAVAANAILYPRVLIATAILNPVVISSLILYLAPPALIAALIAAVGVLRSPERDQAKVSLQNPLHLKTALQMALLFQGVLMAVYLARPPLQQPQFPWKRYGGTELRPRHSGVQPLRRINVTSRRSEIATTAGRLRVQESACCSDAQPEINRLSVLEVFDVESGTIWGNR